MIDKFLKILALSLVIGIVPGQATAANALAGSAAVDPGVTWQMAGKIHQNVSAPAQPACCQSGKTATSCDHCSDGSCEAGSCNTCSHSTTVLPQNGVNPQDAYLAYRAQPVRFLASIYQLTEPRPPRT